MSRSNHDPDLKYTELQLTSLWQNHNSQVLAETQLIRKVEQIEKARAGSRPLPAGTCWSSRASAGPPRRRRWRRRPPRRRPREVAQEGGLRRRRGRGSATHGGWSPWGRGGVAASARMRPPHGGVVGGRTGVQEGLGNVDCNRNT